MSTKSAVWIGMTVGSLIGSYLPSLWGAGMLSMSSIFLSAAGGIAGIWLGLKISN